MPSYLDIFLRTLIYKTLNFIILGTKTEQFAGYRACHCLTNFYRTDRFDKCEPCETQGVNCKNDYVLLVKGYWWKWKSDESKERYQSFMNNLDTHNNDFNLRSAVYNGSMPIAYKCPRSESCLGGVESSCDVGYRGPLCDVCDSGYYKRMKNCIECPTKTWMIVQLSITVVIIVAVLALVVWSSTKKSNGNPNRQVMDIILARLKILVGFYQVLYGLVDAFAYIKWPPSLSLLAEYSGLLQINVLQIAPLHCMRFSLQVDAFGRLLAMMSFNAGVILIALVIYGARKLHIGRNKQMLDDEKVKALSCKTTRLYQPLFSAFRDLSTCSSVAQLLPLACRDLCRDQDKQKCSAYLKGDYTINCKVPSYRRLVIAAYCSIAYVVGLPLISFVILWKHKRRQKSAVSEEQEQEPEIIMGLRFLFENYKDDCWFWELVEMTRKLILTSGLILLSGESRAYVGLACVVSGLFGLYFAYKNPISDPFENKLQLTSLAVTFVNLAIGVISKIPKENIPADVDPYMDNLLVDILVVGINALVIGMLAGKMQICVD